MTDLRAAHRELSDILPRLGVDVGTEVLDVWLDRDKHGYDVLPAVALVQLGEWALRMCRDSAGVVRAGTSRSSGGEAR